MDAYFWENHSTMHKKYRSTTLFMKNNTNYKCNVMPFGLKSAGATYHIIMMNKIFDQEIRELLEVYMDNKIVKYREKHLLKYHINFVFNRVR